MHELDAIFAKEAYDIVGVQEGRLSSSQRLDTEHYEVTTAAAVRGNFGNQLWIAKRISRSLHLEVHELSSTLLVAHGHAWDGTARVPLAIIVAHGPNAKAPAEDIDSYFADLDEVLADAQANAKVIMLADLNATVGEGPRYPDLIGGADAEKLNLPGQRMSEMSTNRRLVALNTFTSQPPHLHQGRQEDAAGLRLGLGVPRPACAGGEGEG